MNSEIPTAPHVPAAPSAPWGGGPQPVFALPCAMVLRPWREADAPARMAAYEDPDVRHWNRPEPMTREEAVARIARWNRLWAEQEGAVWAVSRSPDSPALGLIGLADVDLADSSAEFLYWLLPEGRGRGVMPQGVAAVSEWAFREAGLHRLRICHSVANPASCAVALKAGFPLEGTMRGALLHADGRHDQHLHARLATDA
ncbi:GNAT family N-acetyltransferase [Streptomyces sp. NBC_00091]|uniref:GNAT family N-acetyltransferase n=1 Tax=Streptomyces sp. NBC_00091 TaxID=2975648 RepID=UPI002259B5DC|nr:GNAT family N-acetyltransferase [Streptomyces sp. NBC_00091]MCX5375762.1 GNAT family N-acetyltransferase [Streptomyces sp. NBC_00091]